MVNIYLFCLALGFTFTVGSALLGGLLGGHHDVGGHDGGPDLSTGHEVSGGDYDAGHGEVGHGDGEVGHEQPAMHLPLLSPTVISAFLASFGGAGLLYRQIFGDRPWLHVPLAVVTAAVMGVALAYLIWKITSTFDSNRVAHLTDALGAVAEVSVTIPKDGVGEVAYVSAGTRQTLSARSSDDLEHKQGARVKVLKVSDGVAYVGELPPGAMAAVSEPIPETPGVGAPVRER